MTGQAVMTGASGGLGADSVRGFAQQGANLILMARSADKLETLAAESRTTYQIQVETWPCDLINHGVRAVLAADPTSRGIRTLVNNVGFGSIDDLTDLPPEHITTEVKLSVVALTEPAHIALPDVRQRGRGAVINTANTDAFQSIPRFSTYVAVKAYVLRLSIRLWTELHNSSVRMLAVCPGPTEAGFFVTADSDQVIQ